WPVWASPRAGDPIPRRARRNRARVHVAGGDARDRGSDDDRRGDRARDVVRARPARCGRRGVAARGPGDRPASRRPRGRPPALARTAPPPDRQVQDALEAFAERVGAAIYRARLLETERRTRHQLERTLSRLSRLQTVSDAISEAVPLEEVAASALSASIDALG